MSFIINEILYLCLIYTFLSSFKTFGFFPIFAGLFYLQVLKTSIIKIIEDPLKVFKVEKKTFLFKSKITYYLTDDIFLKDFPNFHQTTETYSTTTFSLKPILQ